MKLTGHETCSECYGKFRNQCHLCAEPYWLHIVLSDNALFLKGDYCVQDCPAGFWEYLTESNRTCV